MVGLQDPGPSPGQAPNGDEVLLLAEPVARANSFVGTEEYLAPEVSSLQEASAAQITAGAEFPINYVACCVRPLLIIEECMACCNVALA